MVAGGAVGAISGFYGGKTDIIVMRFMDILMAIPSTLMAICVVSALGQGVMNLLLAIMIMAAATAELLSFPSIPIKVTLDEYIEIAKYYSTPGSSVFINGVLDKIVEELTAEGRIRKSGRGLLEQ